MPPLSFAQAIRPLIRDYDIEEMQYNATWVLSKYEDVRLHANEIYARLMDGSMPSDGPWPAEAIAKFKQWMEEGMAP